MKRRTFLATVGATIVGIGIHLQSVCVGFPGKSTWELELEVLETETLDNGSIEFQMRMLLSGHVTGTTLHDVELQFIDESQTVRTADIGTLSGYTSKNVTVIVNNQPDRILFQVDSIETGDDTEYWIEGVQRTEAGQYEDFVYEERTC